MAFSVFFHNDFYRVYASDPAAAAGRMEAIVKTIESSVTFQSIRPIGEHLIAAVHQQPHINWVKKQNLFDIASMAAGGAYQAASLGLKEPCFALIRPPGHHASSGNAWGFCYFNNMAIAIEALKSEGKISKALILDIDMHFGDGTVNILQKKDYVSIVNFDSDDRLAYLKELENSLANCQVDIIAISAGFDDHIDDWGGVLKTDDYHEIGRLVAERASQIGAGCFAILEGGYNHNVLGGNVLALINGMTSGFNS